MSSNYSPIDLIKLKIFHFSKNFGMVSLCNLTIDDVKKYFSTVLNVLYKVILSVECVLMLLN